MLRSKIELEFFQISKFGKNSENVLTLKILLQKIFKSDLQKKIKFLRYHLSISPLIFPSVFVERITLKRVFNA